MHFLYSTSYSYNQVSLFTVFRILSFRLVILLTTLNPLYFVFAYFVFVYYLHMLIQM